jgi:pyruvate-ferredoxin/flavodoxin oxidoreductase
VRRNVAAIEAALAALRAVPLPEQVTSLRTACAPRCQPMRTISLKRVTRALLDGQGDALPVSAFPPDGTWPSGTSRLEKRAIALDIPIWQPDLCVQCNRCAMICPHAAIRTKVYAPAALAGAPVGFRRSPRGSSRRWRAWPTPCRSRPRTAPAAGCASRSARPSDRQNPKRKALMAEPLPAHLRIERERLPSSHIPSAPLDDLPMDRRTVTFREPLFEFSGACAGCGETPYLRFCSELFGDRLLIANATGCSSIYGGNLPTTPWTTNAEGRGPAWSNSLFEDNAEFGLGMRLALMQPQRARVLLLRGRSFRRRPGPRQARATDVEGTRPTPASVPAFADY